MSDLKKRRAEPTSTPISSYLYQSSHDNLTFTQPDRTTRETKTLYDLAAEREAELTARADAINASRKPSSIPRPATPSPSASSSIPSSSSHPQPIPLTSPDGPLATAALYALSLTILHFTLTVLVQHQYAQDPLLATSLPPLLASSAATLPVFFCIILTLHLPPLSSPRLRLPRQALLAAASVAAGCYLVHTGNTANYLAVMRMAPPLGCLWIWAVVEMQLAWAVGSLGCVGAWTWWRGFAVY